MTPRDATPSSSYLPDEGNHDELQRTPASPDSTEDAREGLDSTAYNAAVECYRRGFIPIPIPARTKYPKLPKWQATKYINEDELRDLFATLPADSNLGVITGNGLADVDLDAPLARDIANYFLPSTAAISGRKSNPRSHYWYEFADSWEGYIQLTGPTGESLVELRANSKHQTVLPPSTHPEGELYEWYEGIWGGPDGPPPAESSEVRAAVAAIALVTVLVPVWPGEGARHQAFLALVGGLLRHNHENEQLRALTTRIVEVLAERTGDVAQARVSETIRSTVEKLSRGEPTTGWTTLFTLLSTDTLANLQASIRKAITVLREACGLSSGTQERSQLSPPDNSDQITAGLVDGGSFIFDIPDTIPALWGDGQEVLWAQGESLMIVGPTGVGKTTLTGQIVHHLIFGGELLGLPLPAIEGVVLYLAMDRPAQISRSLRRHFDTSQREVISERLKVWKGPPLADLAQDPHMLNKMCGEAGASVVIVDSLKDAALSLSDDPVGAGYNRARQLALANGVEVLELHHQVKRGNQGAAPKTLADVYGSAWIVNGAGSVALLYGAAGDNLVEFSHLKQPAEPVGPLKVLHDHARGVSKVHNTADALQMAQAAGEEGITVKEFAQALFDTVTPSRNEIEKARRKLRSLARKGLLLEGGRPVMGGGKPTSVFLVDQSHSQSHPTCDENDHGPENQSR